MFRKLFGRNRTNAAPSEPPTPEIEIVPVAPAPADEPKRSVLEMRRTPSTKLGEVFPQPDVSVFRRKPATTLKVPSLAHGYAGLAEHIQTLSADIHPKRDTDAQWQQRLKVLQKLAKQVERGEFNTGARRNHSVSDADRDALLALDRLVTLNKGSGDAQKAHRAKLFLTAAHADHTIATQAAVDAQYAHLAQHIDSTANRFDQAIHERLMVRQGTHTVYKREGLPPGSSIEQAGLYTEVAAVLGNGATPARQWRALDAIYQRVADAALPSFGSFEHVTRPKLDGEMRALLKRCHDAPLDAAQRIALMEKAVAQFRPAAEVAHDRVERDAATERAQAERQARILAGEEQPPVDRIAEMNRAEAARREAAAKRPKPVKQEEPRRSYGYYGGYGYYKKPGPLSTERLEDTAKKATIGMGLLSILGIPALYMMRPQVPVSTPEPIQSAEQMNAEMRSYSERMRSEWDAQQEQDNARWNASIAAGGDSTPKASASPKPYRETYPTLKPLPPFDPYAGMSAEDRAYHQCLDRNVDPLTDTLRYGHDCISPDIKRIQDEAAARYSADNSTTKPMPAEQPLAAPIADDLTPPPISEAPRYTPAEIKLLQEALPQLAPASGRKAEPLSEPIISVTFDNPR